MRYYDKDEAEPLNAQPWQLDLLHMNPSYNSWGPHEDYMWKEGGGWDSAILCKTWSEFGPWGLDDLNEVVNFYFSVRRQSEDCTVCGGNGYHKNAQVVVNSFYAHMNAQGEHWNDNITQDEADALIAEGRAPAGSTAEIINAQNRPGARGMMGHDAINRGILTSARLKRLGIPSTCECCGGNGYVYTAPSAQVSLTLWFLHPRKGCSRGVEVDLIEQAELPAVFRFLREAAARNASRFSKLPTEEAPQ